MITIIIQSTLENYRKKQQNIQPFRSSENNKYQYTFSKEETKTFDLPKAKWNALPINGNLSLAFMSISLIAATSFTDTRSCVGPNHSFTIGPYFSCNSDKYPTKRSKKWAALGKLNLKIDKNYTYPILSNS